MGRVQAPHGRGGLSVNCRVAVLVVGVMGCDPTVQVDGLVTASDGGALVNAQVRIECPEAPKTTMPLSSVTDVNGRFVMKGMGCLPKACSVVVLMPGRAVSRTVMASCTKTEAPACAASDCNRASVSVRE